MREMDEVFAVLGRWGYVILAAFVLAEQVPLPVPAVPVLLGIGALAADGRMSMLVAVLIACAAAMPIDLLDGTPASVAAELLIRGICRNAVAVSKFGGESEASAWTSLHVRKRSHSWRSPHSRSCLRSTPPARREA